MAKRGNSVIGIDLGKRTLKSVLLRRKGDTRFVLTNYASRDVPEELESADELAGEIKGLLHDLGGSAKACAIGVSDADSLMRIIEQPDTPVELLRNALKLSGHAVLNQECKDYVLDCASLENHSDVLSNDDASNGGGTAVLAAKKYFVGGMLRSRVKLIADAFTKLRMPANTLQLAPVASFNAFECAYPETFTNEAFLLLDMGHLQSSVVVGRKSELMLVRNIDYGGKALLEEIAPDGSVDQPTARTLIAQGDPGMVDLCHSSLMRLAMEVRNSIGFFEGQHEENIQRIFVSGGLARTETILQVLSDELSLPCEIWDPLETCEVALPAAKRQALPHEFVSLNVACGAAIEYLRNR